MTATTTKRVRKVKKDTKPPVTSILQIDDHKSQTISSFKLSNSSRKPDVELIADCINFAQESFIYGKIIDCITIYKVSLDIRDELPAHKISICDQFLDELESCLFNFLQTGDLSKRRMSFSQVVA